MALAREEYDITRSRAAHGRSDGTGTIGDDQQVLATPSADRLGSGRDGVEDGYAVLSARILVGDDDEATALAGDPAHRTTLAGITLAGGADDRDEPGGRVGRVGRPQLIEHLGQ